MLSLFSVLSVLTLIWHGKFLFWFFMRCSPDILYFQGHLFLKVLGVCFCFYWEHFIWFGQEWNSSHCYMLKLKEFAPHLPKTFENHVQPLYQIDNQPWLNRSILLSYLSAFMVYFLRNPFCEAFHWISYIT